MRHNDASSDDLLREGVQSIGDVLIRQAVKAVALDAGIVQLRREERAAEEQTYAAVRRAAR
ncbi:MAG: hypothetical protein EBX51_04475 [Acidimicrobiia bacterium]|nr:hypothetical protein [Acidimicrobiia bacterium]